jgi:hypothetical protein
MICRTSAGLIALYSAVPTAFLTASECGSDWVSFWSIVMEAVHVNPSGCDDISHFLGDVFALAVEDFGISQAFRTALDPSNVRGGAEAHATFHECIAHVPRRPRRPGA